MSKRAKKYKVLGGIKVSSKQLSEWGKSGGRPKQWASEAERKRAERLRKKQERLGKWVQLRAYHSHGNQVKSKNLVKNSLEMSCSKCGVKSIGGPQHLGGGCWRFCGGEISR